MEEYAVYLVPNYYNVMYFIIFLFSIHLYYCILVHNRLPSKTAILKRAYPVKIYFNETKLINLIGVHRNSR